MVSGSQAAAELSARGAPHREIQALLALDDGERSFGMSLAQKSPALGPKYTVVSTVFADSPADRAGVRKGYVVRRINDKPMDGLTVAQVASHFRNASQARITLEVVETAPSPRTSAFTAQATFGGLATLNNRSVVAAAPSAGREQLPAAPVTGFSVVSSGRAIAAPGTALAVPRVAAPKQPVLRQGAKPAAKTQVLVGGASCAVAGTAAPAAATPASATPNVGAAMPAADPKNENGAIRSKAVAPILPLRHKPKPVQPKEADKSIALPAEPIEPKPPAKSVPGIPSSAAATEKKSASKETPIASAPAIETPTNASGPHVTQAHAQPKHKPSSTGPEEAVVAVPVPPKATPAPAAQTVSPTPPGASKKPASIPASRPVEVKDAAVVTPTASAELQPPPPPSSSTQLPTVVPSFAPQRKVTSVSSNARVLTASTASTVNQPAGSARSLSPAPTVSALQPASPRSGRAPVASAPMTATVQPRSANLVPAAHTPEPAAVSARRRKPPPVLIAPVPKVEPAMNKIPTPVRTPIRATTVARSAPAPVVTKTKTSKKRGRSRKTPEAKNCSPGRKGKGKAKKTHQHQKSDEADTIMDDEDVFDSYAFSSDSDLEESPSKKSACRTARGRRKGVTDRTRHSLTIDRLLGMGFTKEDAEASVREIGDSPDDCMVWIISRIEERQFNEDLNRASIQSEQSKRDEEKRVKQLEKETLAHVEKFMTMFPTSYMVSADSSASRLKNVLASTINQVSAEAYLRKVLTDLLKLEGKSIRWYKGAARSYMLELAGRLETALGAHDLMVCCARVTAADVSSSSASCAFVRKILEEEKALTKALFEMPTNQGGVPPVFLECDEKAKFDLNDDGFEVVELDE